jgi:hypothetical protein
MTSFLHRFVSKILGVLSGFDRVRRRGTLPRLANTSGLFGWLGRKGILWKDLPNYATARTQQLREALGTDAAEAGRPVEYLPGYTDKGALVQPRRRSNGVAPGGLVGAFSTPENCTAYDVFKDSKTHRIDRRRRPRRCLHYDGYLVDDRFGLAQVRLQTGSPFNTHVVLNGREWLARQLDEDGLGSQRRDNCFTRIEDFTRAQGLADLQLKIHWEDERDRLLRRAPPARPLWLPDDHSYWTADQTEWATDLASRDADPRAELDPQRIRRGIETFRSEDVLRFLGRRVTAEGPVPAPFSDAVTSDLKPRPEGVRIKHRAGRNTVKLYDKQGSVLRVETPRHEVQGLTSDRPAADDPTGPCPWRPLRKGVVEMTRRAEWSPASNDRDLEALAALPTDTPLSRATGKLCRSVVVAGRRDRGLNPLAPDAAGLLEAVSRGEWLVVGSRNRALRALLYGDAPDESTRRRMAWRGTRLVGPLRAHGLIKKVPRTHRSLLTTEGTSVIPASLAANNATRQQLTSAA